MAYRKQLTRLKAPYLKRLILEPDRIASTDAYPFTLPFLQNGEFEMQFTTPVTIIVGENGTGKSTLLEAIAGLAGYDQAGGGKGYMPEDHSRAIAASGSQLGQVFRAQWLPKVTSGWFFKAETFYTVARYLDQAALDANEAPPDFLSSSHGEGFLEFFERRLGRQGLFILDEPESALSPRRQIELLRLFGRARDSGFVQIIMATHAPLLMACPHARLLRLTHRGLFEDDFQNTDHFRMMREFCLDPERYLEEALAEEDEL